MKILSSQGNRKRNDARKVINLGLSNVVGMIWLHHDQQKEGEEGRAGPFAIEI
jgi:hypothetical protein